MEIIEFYLYTLTQGHIRACVDVDKGRLANQAINQKLANVQ